MAAKLFKLLLKRDLAPFSEVDSFYVSVNRYCVLFMDDTDVTIWNAILRSPWGTSSPLCLRLKLPADYPRSAPNVGFATSFGYQNSRGPLSGAEYTISPGGWGSHDEALVGLVGICLDILGNFAAVHMDWKSTEGSGWSAAYTLSTLLECLDVVSRSVYEAQSEAERRATTSTLMGQQMFSAAQIAAGLAAMSATPTAAAAADDDDDDQTSGLTCFFSGASFRAGTLGLMVRDTAKASEFAKHAPVPTYAIVPGYLSRHAFETEKVAMGPGKQPFSLWLPAFITRAHFLPELFVAQCPPTTGTSFALGRRAPHALALVINVISTLMVELVKEESDKALSEAFFEILANLWMTERLFLKSDPQAVEELRSLVAKFVASPAGRHKDVVPNLGHLLAAVLGMPSLLTPEFRHAYLHESSLRSVMWWQRAGVPEDPAAVFQATRVSRDLFGCQLKVIEVLVGADAAATEVLMDERCCRLPDRLQAILAACKAFKKDVVDWPSYFAAVACPSKTPPDERAWIRSCVAEAAAAGPRYGGPRDRARDQPYRPAPRVAEQPRFHHREQDRRPDHRDGYRGDDRRGDGRRGDDRRDDRRW